MSETPRNDSEPTDQVAQDLGQTTAQLRAEHHQETSPLQGAVDQVTAFVGRPGFAVGLAIAIIGWICANLTAGWLHVRPVDPPPFVWLQAAVSTMALFVAALILTTQRRENQLAGHREQLILELSILNEQKTSKIIELIEEVRRDSPAMKDRVDVQATAMSTPSDTRAVIDAIKDTQDDTV